MSSIDEYIRLAGSWGDAMENGDSDTANVLYDRIHEVFEYVCQQGQEGTLFSRSNEVSDAAAFFIAAHMNEVGDTRARKLYERLAHSSLPFISLSSMHILKSITADHG